MSVYGPGGCTAKTAEIRGPYRYRLERDWAPADALDVYDGLDDDPRPVPAVTFVMLNPSTADDSDDDPTIRRCVSFARALGYERLVVVNLYNWRATQPDDLWLQEDPVGAPGPYLKDPIERALHEAWEYDWPIIAAWGSNARPGRVAEVLTFEHADRFTCLGVTKDGHPRHPLYVKSSTVLVPWPAR